MRTVFYFLFDKYCMVLCIFVTVSSNLILLLLLYTIIAIQKAGIPEPETLEEVEELTNELNLT